MAIVGGAALGHTNALFTALAVNALNTLVGNIGEPGGIFFTPRLPSGKAGDRPAAADITSMDKLASGILAGAPATKVLLLDGANPVHASPKAWKVRDALDKVPFIASFGSFLDETSALANLILPDHSFLESWVDAAPESGSLVAVASVAAPTMKPLHQTRATADVLLEVAGKLAKPIALGGQKFDEILKTAFDLLPAAADGTDAFSVAQKQGGWWGELKTAAAPAAATTGTKAVAYAEPAFDGDTQQFPFHFLPYSSTQFLDGALAHLPWLQELPDPMTSAMWGSWVELNPKTAQKLGVVDGDLVEIASQHGSLQSAVFISPALAPDVVAMPAGQGHTMFTRFASGRGENPLEILGPQADTETGAFAWAATRVKVTKAGPDDGRLILFAGEKYEKPFELENRGGDTRGKKI
jgi:anaerobic selenocysteine-containing dehydrogenase